MASEQVTFLDSASRTSREGMSTGNEYRSLISGSEWTDRQKGGECLWEGRCELMCSRWGRLLVVQRA